MTNVVDVVFKTLPPFSDTWTVLVQKLGDNVVDFVFKAFVSIITFLGYVASYWTVRVLTLGDFGCR